MIPLLGAASDSTLLESTVAWARTRGRLLLSIAVRGALQLLLSFVFSVFLYAALYRVSAARPMLHRPPPTPLHPAHISLCISLQTFVPQTELTFPLHFGRCEQPPPPPPPPPDGTELALGASAALPPRGERVARVQLSEGQWYAGRPVPAPSGGYPYAVHLCLTLPESPPNEVRVRVRRGSGFANPTPKRNPAPNQAAGMFDVSLHLEAAGGAAGPLLQAFNWLTVITP
jgi:hypothetical protein